LAVVLAGLALHIIGETDAEREAQAQRIERESEEYARAMDRKMGTK